MINPVQPMLSLDSYVQVRVEYFGEAPSEALTNYTIKYKPAKEKVVLEYTQYLKVYYVKKRMANLF